jgi:group I intron endonuclease
MFLPCKKGKHHNCYLQRAFNKQGHEAFVFHVLQRCTEDMLDICERYWIAHYRSVNKRFGYNMEDGGNSNKHLSRESINKMIAAKKALMLSPVYRQKLSDCHKEHYPSPETRKKMSEAQKRRMTPEVRKQMSEARRGKKNHWFGKTHSLKTKQILSAIKKKKPTRYWLGKHRSDSTCKMISLARKGKPWTQARRDAQKKRKKTSYEV